MKKSFLLAITIIGFSISSNAQDIKFGFKGGVNFSTINGDNLDDIDARTGYHIGAVAQIVLTDMFALQPELIYSAQGIKNLDIDYINIPVLLKFKFAKLFSVEAGPQFGFIINDEYTLVEPENIDFSGVLGVGVEFGSFFGQLRYNIGFTDIVKNVDTKNSNFQVSVGYYIF
ncbi:porin family protein [Cellulophaga omnivescoria]|uniref:porin family protein n=1 Tax=Cellulophaga omnivescoria TaxID=1888890 RepID=UPI0009844B80|nr:porin family protein [Cellulophaga omnivescoria]